MVVEKIWKTIDDHLINYDKLVLIKHMKILVFGFHQQLVKHVQSIFIEYSLIKSREKEKQLTRPSPFSTANQF